MSSTAGEILIGDLSDQAYIEGLLDMETEELQYPDWTMDAYREDELPQSGSINIIDDKGNVQGALEFELTFGVDPDGYGGRDVVVSNTRIKRI